MTMLFNKQGLSRLKILLVTMFATAIATLIHGCDKGDKMPKQTMVMTPEVSVVEIKPQRVSFTTELPGRTVAYLIAEVRPQVTGIIQRRLFTEGAEVKAGDVLYQIDAASYEAAYQSATAAVAKAEANHSAIKQKAQRYQELVKINAVSKQDFDDIIASLKQSEAGIQTAKAAVKTAEINLAYTKVSAPISGRIGRSSVTEGALVTANQAAPLATIQQLDTMNVDITQSSAEMLRLRQSIAKGSIKTNKAGQTKVKLILEDNSVYPLEGALKFSEVTVEQSTGSITMRAVFPNPKKELLPGMFVRAVIEEGISDSAILVPQRAVTRNPAGQATVMIVGKEEKVEPRVITVSRTIGDNWYVSDGLKSGDRVIIEGLQRARPGTQVKAVPFSSSVPSSQPTAHKSNDAK